MFRDGILEKLLRRFSAGCLNENDRFLPVNRFRMEARCEVVVRVTSRQHDRDRLERNVRWRKDMDDSRNAGSDIVHSSRVTYMIL